MFETFQYIIKKQEPLIFNFFVKIYDEKASVLKRVFSFFSAYIEKASALNKFHKIFWGYIMKKHIKKSFLIFSKCKLREAAS